MFSPIDLHLKLVCLLIFLSLLPYYIVIMLSSRLVRQLALLLTIVLLFQSYVVVAMPFCSHFSSLTNPLVQHSGHHHQGSQATAPLKFFCDNCQLCSVGSHVYSLLSFILSFPVLSTVVSYLFLTIFFTSFIPEQLQRPPQPFFLPLLK